MSLSNVSPALRQPRALKYLIPAGVLAVLVVAAIFVYRGLNPVRLANRPPAATMISQSTLESQYGLRVNLVSLTAAGGLIDVRLKMVDAAKAKVLLQDSKNYPALWVADTGATLIVPEDSRLTEFRYVNDSNFFILFPNGGNSIKAGTPVSLLFGNTLVEPVAAQ